MAKLWPTAIPAILLIVLLVLAPTMLGEAYVVNVGHDSGFFSVSRGLYSCRFCHVGYPVPHSVGSDRVFTAYRCITCHTEVTPSYPQNHTVSAHRIIYCTDCHEVYHEGHSRWGGGYYYTTTESYYGCFGSGRRMGGGCHQIVSDEIYSQAQPGTSYWSFIVLFYLNATRPKGLNITYSLLPLTTRLVGLETATPMAFVNPFDRDPNTPPSTYPYYMCHSCHFTAPKASRSDVLQVANVQHNDTCYNCHSESWLSLLAAPHTVKKVGYQPLSPPWAWCNRCHQQVDTMIQASVHAKVSCRCHNVLHEAGWNRTAAWITIYYPLVTAAKPPIPRDYSGWKHVLYYDTVNATDNCIPLGPISYLSRYTTVVPFYTLFGDACIPVEDRYLTCLNCHFITLQGQAGLGQQEVQGLIPIPEEALQQPNPHSIQSNQQPKPRNPGKLPLPSPQGIRVLVAATAVAVLVAIIAHAIHEQRKR